MTRFDSCVAAVCATVLLSSCGGSGNGGGTPTPTATSTPTPTPTPTPTFSYHTFAELTGDRTFATACESYTGRGNGVPVLDGSHWYTLDGILSYVAAADSWTVSQINGGAIVTFGPGDLQSSTDGNLAYQIASNPPQRLGIGVPQVGTTNAVYGRSMSYVIANGGFLQSGVCAFGVPTNPADIPAATTVTYNNVALRGIVIDENPSGGAPLFSQVVSGSGTITGNTTTGELTFSLFYVVQAANGTQTTVGPVAGSVGVDLGVDRAGYIGPIDNTADAYRVNGAFFGPQGRETGFVLSRNVDLDHNGLNERFIAIGGFAIR